MHPKAKHPHSSRSRFPASSLSLGILLWALSAPLQAQLDAPAAPNDPASARFTLMDILQRLDSGELGSRRTGGFVEPLGGPMSTGPNLDQIMAAAPFPDAQSGASAGQCLAGRSYWSLLPDAWGPQLGSMPELGALDFTPGSQDQSIPLGFHNGQGRVLGDADLNSLNIRAGIEIFGISGDSNVVDTRSGDAAAGEILTGQVAWVDGQEIIGNLPTQSLSPESTELAAGHYLAADLQQIDPDLNSANLRAGSRVFGIDGDPNVVDTRSGTATAADIAAGQIAWVDGQEIVGTLLPMTRFTDNNDGTITDNNTGTVWLRNANCLELPGVNALGLADYLPAFNAALALRSGLCGLSDGSQAGDWFLPNLVQLGSLIDRRVSNPAIRDNPFIGIRDGLYWTTSPTGCAPLFPSTGSCHFSVSLNGGGFAAQLDTLGALILPLRRN